MTDDINREITLELLKSNPDILSAHKEVILRKLPLMGYRHWRNGVLLFPFPFILVVTALFYTKKLSFEWSAILPCFWLVLTVVTLSMFALWLLDRVTLRQLQFSDIGNIAFWTEFFTSDAEIVLRYIKNFEK